MARWIQPGFNAGVVSDAWSGKPRAFEHTHGLGKADNARLLRDGSITQRPGSEFFLDLTGYTEAKVVPYNFGEEEYLILFYITPSASPGGFVRLYSRVNGEWSTSEVDWLDVRSLGNFNGGLFPTPPFNDTTKYLHQYETLEGLTHVQYKDDLFIMHPDWPPTRIRKTSLDPGYTGGNVDGGAWEYEPYAIKAGGGEVRSFRPSVQMNFESAPFAGDDYFTLEANGPVFDMEMRLTNANPVFRTRLSNLVIPFGAIFRVGEWFPSTDPYGTTRWGNWFSVYAPISANSAAGYRLPFTDAAPTAGAESTGDWAGPWLYTDDSAPSVDITDAFLDPQILKTIDAVDHSFEKDDVGKIVIYPIGADDHAIFFILSYNSDETVDIVNIGRGVFGPTTLTGGKWFELKPNVNGEANCVIFTSESGSINENPNDTELVTMSFYGGNDPLPAGHETQFENLANKAHKQVNDRLVGGAVYANEGVFRIYEKVTLDSDGSALPSYKGVWERTPNTAAPTSSWGYGPSRGTGFPTVGVVHQNRLGLMGMNNPSVLLSRTNNPLEMADVFVFDQFGAADPINFEISEARHERIVWAHSTQDYLFIGTDGAEYRIGGVPLSSALIGVDVVSRYGGRSAGSTRVGPSLLYASYDGRSLYELTANESVIGFLSADLLSRTKVMRGDAIKKVVKVQTPETQVFVITESKACYMLSHNEQERVKGWTKVNLNVIDVIETRGDAQQRKPWLVVEEDEHTVLVRLEEDNLMDYQATSLCSSTGFVTNGLHNDFDVDVFIDGMWQGTFPVTGNFCDLSSLTFPIDGKVATYGKAFYLDANIWAKNLEFPDHSIGKKHSIKHCVALVDESLGGQVAGGEVGFVQENIVPTTQSGWVSIDFSESTENSRNTRVTIQTQSPHRFRLGGVAMEGSVES